MQIAPAFVRIVLVATLPLSFACSGGAQSQTRTSTASIEGRIEHPAQVIPAMRICAIGSGAPAQAKHVCVNTRRSQATYRIVGLAPDDYIVIAAAKSPQYRIGGHVQPVQCIRAPCQDMPAAVTVAAGARVANIDINGFFDKRDDFPAMPVR